jgi:PAS domain S-box-containing protein
MRERVLIVEDDPATSEGLSFHLNSLGFQVSAASDGVSALAAIQTQPPDVLLLDLMLPGDMDGIQILRTAREVAPRVGAIVMTGFPTADTTVQALRLGAYDYVTKPFDLGSMSQLLSKLVQKLRADRQAAERADQFDTLVRCTRLAVTALDPVGRILRWGGEELLGYPAAEMVGRATPAAFILTPGYDVCAELDECRRAGRSVREHRMRHRDGHILDVREERLPLTDRQGRHVGFTSLLLDVTEERQTQEGRERQIGELEARLGERRRALEAVQAVATAVRARTGIAELIARGLGGLQGVLDDVRQAWCFLLEGGDEGLPEVAVVNGRRIVLGGVVGAAPAFGSIPHRCQEGGCDCLARLGDPGGRLFAPVQMACPRLEGPPPGPASHLTLPLVIAGELAGALNLVKTDCASFPPEQVALLSVLADQLAAGIAASRLDARVEAVACELHEQQRRIVQSGKLRAVGELASGVAHDFNNLLTAILGSAELLLGEEASPRRVGELKVIQRAAQDGAETVRRILEFARVRTDRERVPVDLRQVVSEAVELTRGRWRDSVQARGISIQVRLELAPVPCVSGTPAEFRELLTNLILNAVDAMPRGGTLRLATRTVTEPGAPPQVEVIVADSGMGMTPEVLDRIFDPFFTTKGGSGSGLGLSMAYGIVQRHQGEIRVASAPEAGSTFILRFPALPEAAVGQGLPALPPGAPASARRARILVVDDEERLVQLLRAFLELQGHEVLTATGGREALALLGSQRFDCILTDLGMPELSGWDVAREAARHCPETPVMLISGWGAQIDPAEVRAAGIARVIQKPYTFEAIRRALSEVLAGR